jgi:hypothetical protein
MLDAITAVFARDRVAEQFAGPARRPAATAARRAAAARPQAPVRHAAVRALRAVADRLDPATRWASQT